MKTWLDDTTYNLADPQRRKLYEWLYRHFLNEREIRIFVRTATVPEFRINWGGGRPDLLWFDVLEVAAAAGKLRALFATILASPGCEGLAAELGDLVTGAPPAAAAAEVDEKESSGPPIEWHGDGTEPTETKEALISNALVDASFLGTGQRRADMVVRLEINRGESYGTGMLIGPRLVLTNYHVLYDEGTDEKATSVEASFRYQRGPNGKESPGMDRQADVETIDGDKDADWAVVSLAEDPPADIVFEPPVLGHIKPGQRAHIVQHPSGGPKKVALFDNKVTFVNDKVVQYLADTQGGSSGSPVFNDRWQMVALHHASTLVPMPTGKKDIRNEGIHIDRVFAGLTAKGIQWGDTGARRAPSSKGTAQKPAPTTPANPGTPAVSAVKKESLKEAKTGVTRVPQERTDGGAKIYVSFHSTDRDVVDELETLLAMFVEQGLLRVFHKAKLQAGAFVSKALAAERDAAGTFVLISSADAIADNDVYAEWKLAVDRVGRETAQAMVIQSRPAFLEYSIAKDLTVLPGDGPLKGHPRRADAMKTIVGEILKMVGAVKR